MPSTPFSVPELSESTDILDVVNALADGDIYEQELAAFLLLYTPPSRCSADLFKRSGIVSPRTAWRIAVRDPKNTSVK